jgi:hypothetical protein
MYPLGRVLVYSYTRMLAYSPWRDTRLLVTRILPLGEYTFPRILNCSYTRSSELLVDWLLVYFPLEYYTFARLLVCSFARLLGCSVARLRVYSYTR